MKQVVAEPEVASRVVESDLKLRPPTVEEARPIDVLLNQQRNAVGCTKTTGYSATLKLEQRFSNFFDYGPSPQA